jgi:hypothetical protein
MLAAASQVIDRLSPKDSLNPSPFLFVSHMPVERLIFIRRGRFGLTDFLTHAKAGCCSYFAPLYQFDHQQRWLVLEALWLMEDTS